MGVFRQAANAITRFMYGRNGVDALNRALLEAEELYISAGEES